MQGGGIIHAIHVDIQSTNLRVDDLGEIIGDYHTLACDTGNGVAGSTGSGLYVLISLRISAQVPRQHKIEPRHEKTNNVVSEQV